MNDSIPVRFHNYIALKGDVGMEVDKSIIIKNIIQSYKNKWGDSEYDDWIHNDILMLIGFRIQLEDSDVNGLQLWDGIDKELKQTNSNISTIVPVLQQLPLYALFSLHGYISLR